MGQVNDPWLSATMGQDLENANLSNTVLTPKQNATFDRILRAVAESRLWGVVAHLTKATTSLLASNASFVGNSGIMLAPGLPIGQWKHELEHYWHSVSMVQLQRTVVQWAIEKIAADPPKVQCLLEPTARQDIRICKSQLVPSFVYQSFKVVAIVLVVILGTLLTVFGLCVEYRATLIRQWFKKSTPRKHWARDNMLELRRSATKRTPRLATDGDQPPASSQPVTQHVSRMTPSVPNEHICCFRPLPHQERDSPDTNIQTGLPLDGHQRGAQSLSIRTEDSRIIVSLNSLGHAPSEVPIGMIGRRERPG